MLSTAETWLAPISKLGLADVVCVAEGVSVSLGAGGTVAVSWFVAAGVNGVGEASGLGPQDVIRKQARSRNQGLFIWELDCTISLQLSIAS